MERSWAWAAAALVVVAIAVSTWIFRGTARKPASGPEVIPLTSYPGIERFANFSPDGNQVVFSWNGEKQDNFDIYVKLIGAPTPVRLTSINPVWSPNGQEIIFSSIAGYYSSSFVT